MAESQSISEAKYFFFTFYDEECEAHDQNEPGPQSCLVGDMVQTQRTTADFLDNESDDALIGKA